VDSYTGEPVSENPAYPDAYPDTGAPDAAPSTDSDHDNATRA
jgi:hypothetical protein